MDHSSALSPAVQRRFALKVVRRLRQAGFEAYWAGGCVRDRLLGRTPVDYDVATAALPEQIRRVFGYRRTLAVGAAFGVITVVGPKEAGTIEVATFRRDTTYSDGRHPDSVIFATAREDALRRDFTINGLFYDPLEDRVIDFVEGQQDLRRRVIRAIGDPRCRFEEDKLRMLRAIRFAAAFDFRLDPATAQAIRAMAGQITVVSPERIAQEMRRLLVLPRRAAAVRLLMETGLAEPLLPEILPRDLSAQRQLEENLDVLERLSEPGFALALAALLGGLVEPERGMEIGRRWRLSNKEIERTCWLLNNRHALDRAEQLPWSGVQPILVAEGIEDLIALCAAAAPPGPQVAAWCQEKRRLPPEVLDPTPLLTGADLIAYGLEPGPDFRWLLSRVRAAQLDGEVHSQEEALGLVDRLLQEAEPRGNNSAETQ